MHGLHDELARPPPPLPGVDSLNHGLCVPARVPSILVVELEEVRDASQVLLTERIEVAVGLLRRIRVDRFSPYFAEPEGLGVRGIRPDAGYACGYPASLDLGRIAYYFEYDDPTGLPPAALDPVREHVERWQAAWDTSPRPYLGYVRGGAG